MKFFALYMISQEGMAKMMETMSPEQRQAGMDEWAKWMKKHEKDIVDMGAPLGKTKRVDGNGIKDLKNDVGGYSVVEAESHDAAAKLFSDNPHLQMPGAYVEIMEVRDMSKM